LSGFQLLVTLTFTLSRHTAYGRASLIDLYLHTKFHWNRKNVFSGWTHCTDPTKFKVTWHKN